MYVALSIRSLSPGKLGTCASTVGIKRRHKMNKIEALLLQISYTCYTCPCAHFCSLDITFWGVLFLYPKALVISFWKVQ